MDVTPLLPKGHQVIDAYGGGGFKIAQNHYDGSVIVLPEITHGWDVTDIASCTPDTLQTILQAVPKPEVVLIGGGSSFLPIPKALRQLFRDAGMAVEMMDTGAACRTYNILLAEGRRVAAALIAV